MFRLDEFRSVESNNLIVVTSEVFMTPHFQSLADDLWEGNLAAIQTVRTFGDRERVTLEATILSKYGKSISLRGTPTQVQATLEAARRFGS
jgi:hypothetical protein